MQPTLRDAVLRYAPLLIFVVAAALYPGSLGNGYVGWDDVIVRSNEQIRSLAPANILAMFTPAPGATYQPFRNLAYAVIYALSGTDPFGYLLFNLLVHALSAVLVFSLTAGLLRLHAGGALLDSRRTVALGAALLFAVHPLHVEVVSWMQGGKVSLMALFFLLSFYCWLRWREGSGKGFYFASLLLFAVSLLTQPAAAALPLVLVCYELTLGRKLENVGGAAVPVGLAVFFLPAALLAVKLVFFTSVTMLSPDGPGLVVRLLFIPVVWGESLLRFFVPVNLCCRYPLAHPSGIPWGSGIAWAVALVLGGWAAVRFSAHRAASLFALGWWACTMLPTSGLVRTSTLMADRYMFLSTVALSWTVLLLTAGLWTVLAGRWPRRAAAAAGVVCLALLASLTQARQGDWRSARTLWSRVVEVYPRHALGTFNLAESYWKSGEYEEAAGLYRRVLELDPGYAEAYVNLAAYHRREGDYRQALGFIEKALDRGIDDEELWINLGITAAGAGLDSLALGSFNRVIDEDRGKTGQAYYNRGVFFADRGETARAVRDFRQASLRDPDNLTAAMWLNMADILQRAGMPGVGAEILSRGRGEAAFDAGCWRALGNLQLMAGEPADAAASLRESLKRNPDDYMSLFLLGIALESEGNFYRAVEQYNLALAAGPADSSRILGFLGSALTGLGRLEEAAAACRRSLELDPRQMDTWLRLAGAQAGLGLREQAESSYDKALGLAATASDSAGIENLAGRTLGTCTAGVNQ